MLLLVHFIERALNKVRESISPVLLHYIQGIMRVMTIPVNCLNAFSRNIIVQPGECLNSAVVRLATKSRRTVRELASDIGAEVPTRFMEADSIERYRRVLGLTSAQVAIIAPAPPKPGRNFEVSTFGGHEFPAQVFRGRRQVCIECLKEGAFHRSVWTIKLDRACHKHNVYFIQECPGCDDRLTWNIMSPAHCHCGADLRRFQSTPIRSRRETDATGMEIFETLARGEEPALPASLHGFSIMSGIILATGLARLAGRAPFNVLPSSSERLAVGLKYLTGGQETAVREIKAGMKLWLRKRLEVKMRWMTETTAMLERMRPIGQDVLEILNRVQSEFPVAPDWAIRRTQFALRSPLMPEVLEFHLAQDAAAAKADAQNKICHLQEAA